MFRLELTFSQPARLSGSAVRLLLASRFRAHTRAYTPTRPPTTTSRRTRVTAWPRLGSATTSTQACQNALLREVTSPCTTCHYPLCGLRPTTPAPSAYCHHANLSHHLHFPHFTTAPLHHTHPTEPFPSSARLLRKTPQGEGQADPVPHLHWAIAVPSSGAHSLSISISRYLTPCYHSLAHRHISLCTSSLEIWSNRAARFTDSQVVGSNPHEIFSSRFSLLFASVFAHHSLLFSNVYYLQISNVCICNCICSPLFTICKCLLFATFERLYLRLYLQNQKYKSKYRRSPTARIRISNIISN